MPYIKPGRMIDAKMEMMNYLVDGDGDPNELPDAWEDFMRMCAVCGRPNCGKTVVEANGVYVHREDAVEADPVFPHFD